MLPITEIDTTRTDVFSDSECVIAWTINGHITFALDTEGERWGHLARAHIFESHVASARKFSTVKARSADRFGGQCLPLTRHDLAELVARHARLEEIVAPDDPSNKDDRIGTLSVLARHLDEALRLTREYVAPEVGLPPMPGWSWYDAHRAFLAAFPDEPDWVVLELLDDPEPANELVVPDGEPFVRPSFTPLGEVDISDFPEDGTWVITWRIDDTIAFSKGLRFADGPLIASSDFGPLLTAGAWHRLQDAAKTADALPEPAEGGIEIMDAIELAAEVAGARRRRGDVPAPTHTVTVELPEDELRAWVEYLQQMPSQCAPDAWDYPSSRAGARINAALLAYAEEHGL